LEKKGGIKERGVASLFESSGNISLLINLPHPLIRGGGYRGWGC
jgi:hypothetical protein